jgi:hypothetical protein
MHLPPHPSRLAEDGEHLKMTTLGSVAVKAVKGLVG